MKSELAVITLGVDDLERALTFYRDGLGLPTKGIIGTKSEHGVVAFFDLQHSLKLTIWLHTSLAHEANVPLGPRSPTEFALGHNVPSKTEVDAVMEQTRKAAATITDPPHDAFWGGYTGSFQDPDGHMWEVAWNPDRDFAD
ncbi:MAG: VOC family protein [Nitrospirae bacterium]|nr:VOC family protein [Nitrospirota bacterium]MBU6482240.1 VOC family protein [Nitrospirota bacterium]MDE3218140.1 VOC family protein [Nitrospirota bacterium]